LYNCDDHDDRKISFGQQTNLNDLMISIKDPTDIKRFDSISEGQESLFELYDDVGCLESKNLIFDGESTNKSSKWSPKNFNKKLYNFP